MQAPESASRSRWDPALLVRGDESEAHEPGVHGRRGDRFIYLTWGNVGPDDAFEVFRRAKLMLDRVQPEMIERAMATGRLEVAVDLTDDRGGPRCTRIDPPAPVLYWRSSFLPDVASPQGRGRHRPQVPMWPTRPVQQAASGVIGLLSRALGWAR